MFRRDARSAGRSPPLTPMNSAKPMDHMAISPVSAELEGQLREGLEVGGGEGHEGQKGREKEPGRAAQKA